jgi:hypothetical protein
MPVSLERLIAEIEPNVITEGMTRECIQVGVVRSQHCREHERMPRHPWAWACMGA